MHSVIAVHIVPCHKTETVPRTQSWFMGTCLFELALHLLQESRKPCDHMAPSTSGKTTSSWVLKPICLEVIPAWSSTLRVQSNRTMEYVGLRHQDSKGFVLGPSRLVGSIGAQ